MSAVSHEGLALKLQLQGSTPIVMHGRIAEALGTLVTVVGVDAPIGDLCELRDRNASPVLAEVVGFREGVSVLMPFGPLAGLSGATQVVHLGRKLSVPAGDGLLGRVIDGFGRPIDDGGPLQGVEMVPAHASAPPALRRRPISRIVTTGVRCLDGLLTVGEGQRLGIFAPAGVGKSTLVGMLARFASCDVNVIALVGERGREVGEFITHNLKALGSARSVVVVATSDRPAAERIKAAHAAVAIAEHFRACGRSVMFVMDSVTRFARALREVGLASGEPPTRRGYPPSVFAALPLLLERTGNSSEGSITAFFTVLTEGADDDDPIAEEVRSILDGHIVLSRALAQQGQYPAVDVLASVSRVMSHIVEPAHAQAATRVRELMARYRDIELLLQLGEYKSGHDTLADLAVARHSSIRNYLVQAADDGGNMFHAREGLLRLVAP